MASGRQGYHSQVRFSVVSPFEIWSVGLVASVPEDVFVLNSCWGDLQEAAAAGELASADMLLISSSSIKRPPNSISFRPLEGKFDGWLIVVLEAHEDFSPNDFVALDVEGLLLSSARIEHVRECMDHVATGAHWIDPDIRSLLQESNAIRRRAERLSSREREVARLAAQGLSNKRIAHELNVSDGTVKMHMHHVLSKLRLSSRIELQG